MMSEQTFEQLRSVIVKESGIRISRDRFEYFNDKVALRMKARQLGSPEEYCNLVLFDPQELRELVSSLTIGETYFFRNSAHFNALRNFVLPSLIQKKIAASDYEIKIWSAGCSTGEEAYSIAILLAEMGFHAEPWKISILATDINPNALKSAERAVYNTRSVQEISPDILNRYFSKEGANYRLLKSNHPFVNFQFHSLVSDSYSFEEMNQTDIIFCRNVTIYFDLSMTKKVIQKLANCFHPEGYLFIGHAETLWGISDDFSPIEFPETFIYQKLKAPNKKSEAIRSFPISTFQSKKKFSVPSFNRQKVLSNFKVVKKDPIQEIKKQTSENLQSFIMQAIQEADQGKYESAIGTAEKILKEDSLNEPAYYLLGILFAKKKQYEKAIQIFQRLLYIDPKIAIGYFHLGNLFRLSGKNDLSKKAYSNCLKLLEKMKENEKIPFAEELTAGVLYQAAHRGIEALR